MRMLKPRGDENFTLQAIGSHRNSHVRKQHLQGDLAVMLDVSRKEYDSRPSTPDFALDDEPSLESLRGCFLSETGDECHYLRIRGGIELLTKELRVLFGVPQRARSIAVAGECRHQPQ